MKNTIFAFLFSISFFQVQAKKKSSHQEISLTCARLTFDIDTKESLSPSIFSGLMFKKYYGKIAIRAGIDYATLNISGPKPKMFGTWYDIQKNKLLIQTGIQKTIKNGKKLQFYDGIDVVYEYQKRKGSYNLYGDFPPYNQSWTINSQQHNFGIAPLLGIQYFISKKISLNAEATVFVGYYYINGALEPNRKTHGITTNASPINRIAICFRF